MFISVKEAADLTGKSSTTIYRLCNKRINTLYVRKEDNKFLINRDFLLATYPPGSDGNERLSDTENYMTSENNENLQLSSADTTNKIKSNDEGIKNLNSKKNQTEKDEKLKVEEITDKNTSEAEEIISKSLFSNIISWEVIIGISVSLLMIAIFIYLLSVIG
ncbi:MAG: helix-turn-helix domain-containing protein [Bacteroidales bacterium]|nr:helix-turn-helix domain-containing protein [Bacteroidales bacterium]